MNLICDMGNIINYWILFVIQLHVVCRVNPVKSLIQVFEIFKQIVSDIILLKQIKFSALCISTDKSDVHLWVSFVRSVNDVCKKFKSYKCTLYFIKAQVEGGLWLTFRSISDLIILVYICRVEKFSMTEFLVL